LHCDEQILQLVQTIYETVFKLSDYFI